MNSGAEYEIYFNNLIRELGLMQWTDNVPLIMHHATNEWLEYIIEVGGGRGLSRRWIRAASDELAERLILR